MFTTFLLGWCALISLFQQGKSCNLTLNATFAQEKQTAIVGGTGLCTWTFSASEIFPHAIVEVRIDSHNVFNGTCDPTNSITIYDGDTEGHIIGLVCREHKVYLQSSGKTLTLTYPAGDYPTNPFTVEYKMRNGESCSSLLYAVSETEYSLASPNYFTGVVDTAFLCDWTIFLGSYRGRVVIETTSNNCSEVNATIDNLSEELKSTWCAGQNNVFQSWQGSLKIIVRSEGPGVMLKYRRLDESQCSATLNATEEEQFFSTPNYPQPFPRFTECRWEIINTIPKRLGLRIEVVDMDVETTESCSTDKLTVKNDMRRKTEVGSACSGNPIWYLYDFTSLVIFQSTRDHNAKKGLRVKYYLDKPEPCGGNLTADNTTQTIQTPGYPFLYPNSAKCVWRITATEPSKFIQVQIVHMKLFQPFGSCTIYGDFVGVYEGTSETGYSLGRFCDQQTPTLVGSEQSMTIVFKSDDLLNDSGFNMTYREVEVSEPLPRHYEAKLGQKKSLTSPRYPDGKVKNLNMSWTVTGSYKSLAMFTFTDVDLGDPSDCSKNYIKVFYGNTSSSQYSTLCGKETGVFMNKDMTIKLIVGDNLQKGGFRSNYKGIHYIDTKGCDGTISNITAYSVAETMKTVNYPNQYPNMLNCLYLISGFTKDYKVHITNIEADMGEEPCEKDYFEIFDGSSTSSKSFGRFCKNYSQVLTSTGQSVLVKFVSDSNGAGKGGRITYENRRESTTDHSLAPIIIGSLVGAVVVCLGAAVVIQICRKKNVLSKS